MDVERMYEDAIALHGDGQLKDAERLYRSILARDGQHVAALVQLGTLLLQQARHADALEPLQRALLIAPEDVEAHVSLGTAMHMMARYDEAVQCFRKSLAGDADHVGAHYGMGLSLQALGSHDQAIASLQRALVLDPDYVEASCALGAALQSVKQYARSIGCFEQAIALDSDYVEAICGRAESLAALGRQKEAIAGYGRAIAIRPDHAQAHCALGALLVLADGHIQALEHFRAAVALQPDCVEAWTHLGNALEELGKIDDAHRAFEAALALDPENIRSHYALIMAKDIRDGDPIVAQMEKWISDDDKHEAGEKILLHFGLAKALSDVGQQDRSFQHLLAGNALKRHQIHYDEAGTLAALDRIRMAFTADVLHSRRGMGHPSSTPILIVGMPRSGSTLIEQILASHPSVAAGGERPDFLKAMNGIPADVLGAPCNLTEQELRRLGGDYLERLAACAPGKSLRHITDKMLANFCFVGLIHLALPNARFIHACRDPVATCLSCFSKLFGSDQPFTYDLAELGRYYRGYAELMEHWQHVMPPGVMLDVRYEELVANFEAQARRIIDHCGLQWDEACLSFYRTERPVRTASVSQVRKPIYHSSVRRWQPEPAILQPLLDGLGAAGKAVISHGRSLND